MSEAGYASVTPPTRPVGRPCDYSPETAAELCTRMSGGRSLRDVCEDDDMPSKKTVFEWLGKFPEFRDQYAPARDACLEYQAEEILVIADDATNDWMTRNDPENPGWLANHDHINRSRLRIDTRKWLLSKLLPKKYGDRIEVDQQTRVTHSLNLEGLPDTDINTLMDILGRAQQSNEPKVIGASSTVEAKVTNGSGAKKKTNGHAKG